MMLFVLSMLFSSGLYAQSQNLGVLWIGKSGMAQRVLSGLEAQLAAKSPGISIEVKSELSKDAAEGIYQSWQNEKDAIVFLRSNGAQFLAQNPPSIPAFIGACNHPKQLGAVDNLEAPEGNITGVTYFLNAMQHIKTYKQMMPSLSSVGLLVEAGHPGSEIDQAGTQAACQQMDIAYHEAVIGKDDDLAAITAELASNVDILIIGNEALIIDNAEIIANASGNTPVASYAEKPVTAKHALIGVVASDEKLGRLLGDSVVDVLVNGKTIQQVPVKTDNQPRILICADKMKRWQIRVPMQLLKVAEIIK